MKRPLLILLLALGSCGKGAPPAATLMPITGTLQLTLTGAADPGTPTWAVLRRDGADEFKTTSVPPGAKTAIEWREDVQWPREWRLKFGPSKHPTYQLILIRGGGTKPEIKVNELDSWRDPARSLAFAYFAIPLDGIRELTIDLSKPAPLEVSVCDSAGAPVEGIRVVGITTPKYHFHDGFDPEKVDALQQSWSWDFWNFDHAPKVKLPPERLLTRKTDAQGRCSFDGFTGWVGVSERDERFATPRSVLITSDVRLARFSVARPAAGVRLTVEGLPGKDYTITERGLTLEGDWPVPPGWKPVFWTDKLSMIQGKTGEFFTPCREVRLKPMSPMHRITSGDVVKDIVPGESRKHKVVVEEVPHKTIEGEVQFPSSDSLVREHCTVELYDGATSTLLRALGNLGGPGVPKSGRVPFAFHVEGEGPYTIAVRTGDYGCPVVRDIKAPREELIIPLTRDLPNVRGRVSVKGKDGATIEGFIVGEWPHRELLNSFGSGSTPSGKPGLNTFVIQADAGTAVLRDVEVAPGKEFRLEATLTPGATLRGRIVDAAGKPVAGQWVHLSWPGYFRMPSAYRWLSDLTNDDGRFEIRRVQPGPWRVYARGTGVPAGAAFTLPPDRDSFEAGDLILPRP